MSTWATLHGRGSRAPARPGTGARSVRTVGVRDRSRRTSRSSTPSRRRSGGRVRSARPGCVDTPTVSSPGPSAAPALGSAARRAVDRGSSRVGPVAGDGGRPAGRASAAAFGVRPAAAGAGRAAAAGSVRGAAQHGNLVAEHQDFDVLGRVGPGEQRQPALGVAAGLSGRTTVGRACRPGRSRRGSRRVG